MSAPRIERRRCQGEPDCLKPLRMTGPKATGVYYHTDGRRVALCWSCYDIWRGAKPRPSIPTEWG